MTDHARFLRLYVPDPKDPMDRAIYGSTPFVMNEGPRGVGREVRLASEAETGLWVRVALPTGSAT